jgi:hypothetical protein
VFHIENRGNILPKRLTMAADRAFSTIFFLALNRVGRFVDDGILAEKVNGQKGVQECDATV